MARPLGVAGRCSPPPQGVPPVAWRLGGKGGRRLSRATRAQRAPLPPSRPVVSRGPPGPRRRRSISSCWARAVLEREPIRRRSRDPLTHVTCRLPSVARVRLGGFQSRRAARLEHPTQRTANLGDAEDSRTR